jgi:hypothetical protein
MAALGVLPTKNPTSADDAAVTAFKTTINSLSEHHCVIVAKGHIVTSIWYDAKGWQGTTKHVC